MELQDHYRYPHRPDYEPRLWAQFDNKKFPRQGNGDNPQIKWTPENKQGKIEKKPPELGQHTAHSQSEIKGGHIQKKKKKGRTRKKKFNIYMYNNVLDLIDFNSTLIIKISDD